jgi:ATP-dependent DNA ligase
VIVPTVRVSSIGDMIAKFREFRAQGYEGAIVRNVAGLYANKRSNDLQKVVETITEEFPIMGVEEGSGKLQGHVGAFYLTAKNGKQFKAKLQGSLDRLKDLWEHPEKWQGKQMTVRYRTLTRKNKVPRFPIAVEIRDYE